MKLLPISFVAALFAAAAQPAPVLRMSVSGAIDPPISSYLRKGIAKAEAQGAQAVLIELDTPGGLLDSTREIVQAMLSAKVPVIVYTTPHGARATSAGVFLMMAADFAAMAPNTHIGAAHPVSLGGAPKLPEAPQAPDGKPAKPEGKPSGSVLEEKAVSDAAAYIRTLATERGRNAAWAEKAVRESVSLTASEALAQKVVDAVAEDRADLFKRLDGRRVVKGGAARTLDLAAAPVEEFALGDFAKVLHVLANPNFAYIFLMLGLYGLIYEFSSPGVGFGAVVGLTSLALAAYSMSLLPVNYTGLLFVVFGMVLLVLETQFVSHGLLSVGGLVLLGLGSLFLFDSTAPLLRVSRPLIFGTLSAAGAFSFLVLAKILEARRAKPLLGPQAMVGLVGEVRERIDPVGMVFVDGELWTAESKTPLAAGAKVRVREVRGAVLIVDAV